MIQTAIWGYRAKIIEDDLVAVPINRNKEQIGRFGEDIAESGVDACNLKYVRNQINGLGADFILPEHNCLIEVKYWGDYQVSPFLYKSEILPRFQIDDPHHMMHWILMMPKLHCSEAVKELMRRDNIYLIEIGLRVLTPAQRILRRIVRVIASKLKNLLRVFSITSTGDSEEPMNSCSFTRINHFDYSETFSFNNTEDFSEKTTTFTLSK